MSVEIEAEYGGTGSNFFSTVLTIEEIAKVDPAVGACCDVQNTLINAYFRQYALADMREKYLPRLCQGLVSYSNLYTRTQWG